MNKVGETLDKLAELKLLDLNKCCTVADIVDAMRFCSFGARNLGEVFYSIAELIKSGAPFDFLSEIEFRKDLVQAWNKLKPKDSYFGNYYGYVYPRRAEHSRVLLIFGAHAEHEKGMFSLCTNRKICVNNEHWFPLDQCRDGYFPDVVFSDPEFIFQLLIMYLNEKISGQKTVIDEQFMRQLEQSGTLGQDISRGAEIFWEMISDPDCAVLLTMSGAMTIAQMGLVVCDLIDNGMVQSLTTTGAAMAHGLVESIGLKHYKYNSKFSDEELAKVYLNRVTDTLESETNFDHIADAIEQVLMSISTDSSCRELISYSDLYRRIGDYISVKFVSDRGILKSAFTQGIPVFTPAFVDSEIYNDIFTFNLSQRLAGKPTVRFNEEQDNQKLIDLIQRSKRVGIFSIGGGVPRNWTQNVAPLIELINHRVPSMALRENPFSYGVRICPDPMDLGHLSGCTYNEGKSWRKMDLHGRFAEIRADATMILPFIVKYAMNKLAEK